MRVLNVTLLPFFAVLFLKGVQSYSYSLLFKNFKDVIGIFKDPFDKTLMSIGNDLCDPVKKIIGVDYEDVAGGVQPDLNRLTLKFVSKNNFVRTFPLNMAARFLSMQRGYNLRAKFIIYIHGFIDDPHLGPNFGPISEAFLSIGEYNILGLDASSLIRYFYLRSTTYVRFIGERLGEVLAALVKKGLDPKSIHLIGHSLGSHIAGFTGKQFTRLTRSKVGRISGLDPAGPCFHLKDPKLRLNASDADFVDVIHTDAGFFGITEPIGHVDFYPNGGSRQPKRLLHIFSHLFVNQLYTESITSPAAFPATACSSYADFNMGRCYKNDVALMGYACEPTARGVYYLRTGYQVPYGLGEEGI